MKRKIQGGVYLIIDPSTDQDVLLSTLKEMVREKIAAVQIWDNFSPDTDQPVLIEQVLRLCHLQNIPVLINNQWELLKTMNLDGVHFDKAPRNIVQLKQQIGREVIAGITCNNDLSAVKWADENRLDYISFCSMFPSSTANSCDLVSFDTVRKAKEITDIPIFLAGGINPENLPSLSGLNYSGIAVVSGIMSAANPLAELKRYQKRIEEIIK
ncbi:thiamine phosphate synthase [Niabella sp. 22666]|uniref:thiamine phosphate synthase n=1 Tax=Niabella sp. 22666 TaxID=3453954 RepID=UPI003F826C70